MFNNFSRLGITWYLDVLVLFSCLNEVHGCACSTPTRQKDKTELNKEFVVKNFELKDENIVYCKEGFEEDDAETVLKDMLNAAIKKNDLNPSIFNDISSADLTDKKFNDLKDFASKSFILVYAKATGDITTDDYKLKFSVYFVTELDNNKLKEVDNKAVNLFDKFVGTDKKAFVQQVKQHNNEVSVFYDVVNFVKIFSSGLPTIESFCKNAVSILFLKK